MEHRLVGAWVIDLIFSTDRVRSGTGERDARALGTLLGPEGPGAAHLQGSTRHIAATSCGPSPPLNHPSMRAGRRQGIGTRPYLENCTVDASIFVAKLIRAHGGCLGTRSRRRT